MLAAIVTRELNFHVVAEAAGGIEGLRLFRITSPNLVILDLCLPELNGVQLIRLLRNEPVPPKVAVYTGAMDEEILRQASELQPDAMIRKEDTLQELRDALRGVMSGGRYVSSGTSRVMRRTREHELSALTPQELAVLQMVAEGRPSKEIAEALRTSLKTVEHHRQHVMQKLNVHDVASLTRYAIRNRLLMA